MDKDLIRRRFAKAARTYMSEAVAQRQIAGRLLELVDTFVCKTMHERVLEVGCGTGAFTWRYLERYAPTRLWLNDLCSEVEECYEQIKGDHVQFISGDAESIDLPDCLTLIVSCSALQWFNSQEMFFRRCLPLLSDGAYLAFATFGQRNMCEVSQAAGIALPYRSLTELQDALAGEYEILHSSEEIIRMEFDNPVDVLRHLKLTGVTGIGSKAWTRRDLVTFCSRYDGGRKEDGGKVVLTYHPIYFVTRKKHKP